MSLGQDAVEFGAEKKFWATPELVDKLLRRLDLDSTKKLAESHKLTRQILGRPFHWSKLIKHTFQEGDSINVSQWSLPKEDDLHLASMRPRVKLLSQILNMIEEPEAQLELDLLHTICDSYLTENISKDSDWPPPDNLGVGYFWERTFHQEQRRNYVSVSCPCQQVHEVSPWGFVLLNDVEDTLGSRKQGIEEVVVLTRLNLQGPLLIALASKVARQQELVKNLDIWSVVCDNKESAEALATLVEHSSEEALHLQGLPALISVDGVGAEGWAAIRRAVECLAKVRPWNIAVRCKREAMIGGRKEDLKAIWFAIQYWMVHPRDEGYLGFDKEIVGDVGGWEGFEGMGLGTQGQKRGHRKGLDAIMDMTEEDLMEELMFVCFDEEDLY